MPKIYLIFDIYLLILFKDTLDLIDLAKFNKFFDL